ncbi:P2X purinoceptor 7-like [Ixodes scapularis]
MACLHDESGGSGSGYDDISEDEDVNRSLVAMVGEKRFGLEPYLYDPSASSSATDEESSDSPETPGWPGSPHPPAARRVGTANWCSCGSVCRPMQTVEESVCCRELHNVVRMCSDQGVPCVTKHPLFELYCLNTDILDLEHLKLRYFCPLDAGDRGPQERHRYTAYRQFTWWVHHKLGRGNRVPLPSCAVQRIRREFRSTDGSYVGFKK